MEHGAIWAAVWTVVFGGAVARTLWSVRRRHPRGSSATGPAWILSPWRAWGIELVLRIGLFGLLSLPTLLGLVLTFGVFVGCVLFVCVGSPIVGAVSRRLARRYSLRFA